MNFLISNQDLEANQELLSKVTLRHGDITAQDVDAIFAPVPFRNKTKSLLTDAICTGAGDVFQTFIDENLMDQKAGYSAIAPSGQLPCQHVIACVTPKWGGGFLGEDRDLTRCFEGGIKEAAASGCRRLAIPVFLTGNHGYPKPRAVRLAIKAVLDTASADQFDEIRFVAFKEDIYDIFQERLERYGWEDQ